MGNNIKILREFSCLTQKQLSDLSGITQPKISMYEKYPDLDTLTVGTCKKLSAALNCTIDDLISDLFSPSNTK